MILSSLNLANGDCRIFSSMGGRSKTICTKGTCGDNSAVRFEDAGDSSNLIMAASKKGETGSISIG